MSKIAAAVFNLLDSFTCPPPCPPPHSARSALCRRPGMVGARAAKRSSASGEPAVQCWKTSHACKVAKLQTHTPSTGGTYTRQAISTANRHASVSPLPAPWPCLRSTRRRWRRCGWWRHADSQLAPTSGPSAPSRLALCRRLSAPQSSRAPRVESSGCCPRGGSGQRMWSRSGVSRDSVVFQTSPYQLPPTTGRREIGRWQSLGSAPVTYRRFPR